MVYEKTFGANVKQKTFFAWICDIFSQYNAIDLVYFTLYIHSYDGIWSEKFTCYNVSSNNTWVRMARSHLYYDNFCCTSLIINMSNINQCTVNNFLVKWDTAKTITNTESDPNTTNVVPGTYRLVYYKP